MERFHLPADEQLAEGNLFFGTMTKSGTDITIWCTAHILATA